MIVVSGALVVLSIILLVTGLVASDDLTLIYFSIGSSVLAGVFLLLGALQRRDDKPATETAAPEASTAAFERVTSVNVTKAPATAAAASVTSGPSVSVVPGRPRFHTDDCRFLAGRPDVESIGVDEARTQGYTECGVCKPSEVIGAGASTRSVTPALMNDDDVSAQADDALDDELAAPSRRTSTATKAPARSTTAARAKAAPVRSTARGAAKATTAKAAAPRTATKSSAARTPARALPSKPGPARTVSKASPSKSSPASAAMAPSAAKAAAKTARPAAKASPAGSVVVIPDRDKFHTTDCRFVRNVDGTLVLTKATARRQGYLACGVCKP